MPETFQLAFGAISAPLATQLIDQDLNFNDDELAHFQADHDAIVRLKVRGYVSDTIRDNLYNKLHKRITKHVQEQNK